MPCWLHDYFFQLNTLNEFHGQDAVSSEAAINPGNPYLPILPEIVIEMLYVMSLLQVVKLILCVALELCKYFLRINNALLHMMLEKPCKVIQDFQVSLYKSLYAWTHNLDSHLFPALKLCNMHLPDACAGNRLFLKAPEKLFYRLLQLSLDNMLNLLVRKRLNIILQLA